MDVADSSLGQLRAPRQMQGEMGDSGQKQTSDSLSGKHHQITIS